MAPYQIISSFFRTPRVLRSPPIKQPPPSLPNAYQFSRQFPNSPFAAFRLAEALASQKHYEEAARIYQKVIALDPAFVDAYWGLASIYSKEKQWKKAKEILVKVTKISNDPKDCYDCFLIWGNIALDAHQETGAKEWLREAKEAYEKALHWMQEAEAFYGLGIVAARQRLWEDAKGWFEEALKRAETPRQVAKALEGLANIWKEKGQSRKAEILINLAKKVDPTYPAALFEP